MLLYAPKKYDEYNNLYLARTLNLNRTRLYYKGAFSPGQNFTQEVSFNVSLLFLKIENIAVI